MAKKSGGRSVNKARKRSVQRPEAGAEAPVSSPQAEPMAEAPARQPISLRQPGGSAATYSVRRDRRPAATASSTLPVDYSYVLSDLRRVGVLVAMIVTALVILTFFLR